MEKKDFNKTCCICGKPLDDFGNNALPYRKGRCCNECNEKYVIPTRAFVIHLQNN